MRIKRASKEKAAFVVRHELGQVYFSTRSGEYVMVVKDPDKRDAVRRVMLGTGWILPGSFPNMEEFDLFYDTDTLVDHELTVYDRKT